MVGVCKPGAVQDCFDSEQCTADSCDSKTGKCSFTPLNDGECDDGNLCTLNDECASGKCKAGSPPSCGDGDPCTTDNCTPDSGKCKHDPVTPGAACDDGNMCTDSSKCVNGKCIGAGKPCDDGNPCTADVCDPQSGKCNSTALKDGSTCGQGLSCKAGICVK